MAGPGVEHNEADMKNMHYHLANCEVFLCFADVIKQNGDCSTTKVLLFSS